MTESGWLAAPERRPLPRRTPVADLFEEAFRLYRRGFVTMLVVFGAFEIPFVLANLPLTILQARSSQAQFESNAFPYVGPEWSDALGGQLLVYLLLLMTTAALALLLLSLAAGGVTVVAGAARTGGAINASEAFAALRGASRRLIGLVLILAGGLVVISLPFAAAALVEITAFGDNLGLTFGLLALLGLGLMVLLVFLGARLAVAIPALVLERLDPMSAMRRSWNLVRGSTWRVIGIVYLAVLLIGLVGSFMPMLLVPGLYRGLLTGSVDSYVQLALVSGAVNLVLGPILPTLVAVLFFDLAREPAEGAS